MNSDERKAQERTGGCVASLPLYNSTVKLGVAWYPLCGGDVRAFIIAEANITPARGLTLTGQRVWGGGQPPPQHTQLCVQPSLAFERPLRLRFSGPVKITACPRTQR